MGNDRSLKLKTPELRKKVFDHFCEHVRQGFSKECWHYSDETGLSLTLDAFDRYMREYEHEFDMQKYKSAFNEGLKFHEQLACDIATGTNPKGNVAALQMILRNKYGWDKKKEQPQIDPKLLENFTNLMTMLSSNQKKSDDDEDDES